MKKILGLDLGTNSIGWALIDQEFENQLGTINGMGSRIIPMTQDVLGKFDSGVSISQTAERTGYRSVRRLGQRDLLRRERLHRVLNLLGFLPEHYAASIDFDKHLGQYIPGTEPKIVYKIGENGKHEFLFMDSFFEMVEDFKKAHPHLLVDGKKIPHDWTIYYLRKKALTAKISKEELSWLLLNFNQKRGYYQLRGEEENIDNTKLEEFYALVVKDVINAGERNKAGFTLYKIVLENNWEFIKPSKNDIDWKGKVKEFIITTELDEDGIEPKKDKEGKVKRTFRSVDSEKDWIAIKKKTEIDISKSTKTVGCFIYEALLNKPTQKINGKLVRTIERKFYKEELTAIIKSQIQWHPQLSDSKFYLAAIQELYPYNEAHKNNIRQKDFVYLFLDDIIFYQRPLKSKLSLISNCSLETKKFTKDGLTQIQPLKCIAKSHPLYQEFRLLQFVKNLKIYEREKYLNDKLVYDVDITNELLPSETDTIALLNWLNDKFEITQKQLLAYPKFKLKEDKYRWNFVEDKVYPCNETRSVFLNKAAKLKGISASFFDDKNMEALWHILYSVTDKVEIEKAIAAFTLKHQLPVEFIPVFSKLKPYDKDYGAFSSKALKKLLPLMRMGSDWSEAAIDTKTKLRIESIITGEYDETLKNRVRDKAINLKKISDFQGLPLWLASYIVYDRHSEANDIAKWIRPADIDDFLKHEFKQHSLRNPIVEQVITETLRVVKDIWIQYGEGKENFFDEIHIELGREMKNPADKRKRMTEQISQNENTNLRLKALLTELKNDGIIEVRPYSPSQQEILKIYEEGVYQSENRKDQLDEVDKIRKNVKPSKSEIVKYKLWLEQGYISPYTGKTIPLNKLFSTNYQIEHIFPQSRFFDDSLSNKIICESEVNQLKDNRTAFEFILFNKGRIVELNGGGSVKLFTKEEYETHIERYFAKNKTKQKNLLSEDIPESFINRQLNDSRYISKVVKNLLSKIVREEKNGELEQETTSKNIVTLSGAITSRMKQDWGLNDVWNHIITPRFERLNAMTNNNDFGGWENKSGKQVFQTTIPDEIAKGFSKKRIDHRHHALDALVIACTTKDHVNYLTSINTERKNYSLVSKLRHQVKESRVKADANGNSVDKEITVSKDFRKPWETFTQDAREKLQQTIVSFKQNIRVINKSNNKYQKWMPDENGKMIKETVAQTKGDNWAIRKPLHKETVYGKVVIKREKDAYVSFNNALDKIYLIVDKEIKRILSEKALVFENNIAGLRKYFKTNPLIINETVVDKVKIYEEISATAGRVKLDSSFDENKIKSVTDTAIQQILFKHLARPEYQRQTDANSKPIPPQELAFSEDGLDEMNKGLTNHKPIYKVRTFEEGSRFAIGQTGNKKDKYVEAAKGTNLFFAVYHNIKGGRTYKTIPLNEVIESQKMGLANAPETDENGNQLLFTLSPNDLVFIPSQEENFFEIDLKNVSTDQAKRIYKMVSFSGNQAFFVMNNIATSIVDKMEFSALNKMEKDLDGNMIKSLCWKLKVNRLGEINK